MSVFPQIFAFYSFKGGVGRSMAVLNLAFALAARRRNVLVLDMDLEAPGLSGFLHRTQEIAGFARSDMVDLVRWASEAVPPLELASFPPLADYAVRIPKVVNDAHPERLLGRLDIIPVEEERDYYERLAALDMGRFDQDGLVRTGSVLREWLKSLRVPVDVPDYYGPNAEREAPYDYVLVDSRTGITETGGLCIGPLSDQLVIVTALNDQNVEGTSKFLTEVGILPRSASASAHDGRTDNDVERKHEAKPYLIVASLVPAGEIDKKQERLVRLAQVVGEAVIKLSYHPQLALQESIFTRDHRGEYLAREYDELLEQILSMANDGDDESLPGVPLSLSRSPAKRRVEAPRSPGMRRDQVRRRLRAAPATGSDPLLGYLLSTADFDQVADDIDFILWDQVCRVLCRGDEVAPWDVVNAWANSLGQWGVQSKDSRLAALRYNAALSRYQEILRATSASPSQKAVALFNRGITYGQMGQPEKEIEDYTAIIEMRDVPPDDKADALYNRGFTYGQMNQHDKAIDDYAAVIGMNDAPPERKADALLSRGVTYGQMNQHDEAIDDYTAVIGMNDVPPEQKAWALVNRGVKYGQRDQAEKAIDDYTTVIGLSGATPEQRARALINRGVKFRQRDQAEKAIDDYTTVIEMSGTTPEQQAKAFRQRGSLRYLEGRYQGAIEDERRAIALDPKDSTARANLALTLLVSGERDEAFAAYDDAFRFAAPKGLDEMTTDLRGAIAKHGDLPGAQEALALIEARRLELDTSGADVRGSGTSGS